MHTTTAAEFEIFRTATREQANALSRFINQTKQDAVAASKLGQTVGPFVVRVALKADEAQALVAASGIEVLP